MDTTESIIASQKEEISKYKERLKGEKSNFVYREDFRVFFT
jgi:hypothetical protein